MKIYAVQKKHGNSFPWFETVKYFTRKADAEKERIYILEDGECNDVDVFEVDEDYARENIDRQKLCDLIYKGETVV